jgi:hypothetical protein
MSQTSVPCLVGLRRSLVSKQILRFDPAGGGRTPLGLVPARDTVPGAIPASRPNHGTFDREPPRGW